MDEVMGDVSLASFTAPVHGRLELSSAFQPIFSPAHRRAVAFEGLIRARDKRGRVVPPLELFSEVPAGETRILLDRQCRSLHVSNFMRFGEERSWLFLNVDPYVAIEGRQYGSFFAGMLRAAGLSPHRVAVELIESPLADEGRLASAMEYYRELGCIIVLDDFGAGHSNFDRIWRLNPDIVKIDREMTRRVTVEPLARRMFNGIVSVLHEAGALVCVEGIETEDEALCATDANADLLQGHYFASPASELPAEDVCRDTFTQLFSSFRAELLEGQARREARLEPYLSARDPRLEPMRPRPGTNWQNKPYFRRAMADPGTIQVTRPYLSVTGPKICVTLSLACEVEGAMFVICADLDLAALAGAAPGRLAT